MLLSCVGLEIRTYLSALSSMLLLLALQWTEGLAMAALRRPQPIALARSLLSSSATDQD